MPTLNGTSFAFRQRRERIDWKKLASVDVDKVTRDVDFQTLQDNVANVTFCDIEAELEPNVLDGNFVKLFRLAQLIVEYLVHSQDCLSATLTNLELQLSDANKQLEKLKDAEMVQKKTAKNSQTPAVPCVIVNNAAQHQCPHCAKAFLNRDYLNMHIQRRHAQRASVVPFTEVVGTSKKAEEEVEKQLGTIKERLDAAEVLLKEERAAMKDSVMKEQIEVRRMETELRREMDWWKTEQLENHNKELHSVRDMFLTELKSINEKYVNSEKQLQELQSKADGKSNLGPLIDEEEINLEILKKQQREMENIKEHLHEQVAKVEDVVRHQLKEQERLWKAKLKQMQNEHHSEIAKLTETFETRVQHVSEESLQEDPLELSLNRQIKELERINLKQRRRLKERENQLKVVPLTTSKNRSKSVPPKVAIHSSQDSNFTGEDSNNQSLENTQEVVDRSMKKIKSLMKHNPVIIQGMREEVSHLLEERLEQIGVARDAGGVKDSALTAKLANQKAERQGLSKKYNSLLSLREQLQSRVDKAAQKKLKTSNNKSLEGSFSSGRRSLKGLFSSMKEKVRSVTLRSGSRSRSPPAFVRRNSSAALVAPVPPAVAVRNGATFGRSGEITTLPYSSSSSSDSDDEEVEGSGGLSVASSSEVEDDSVHHKSAAVAQRPKTQISFEKPIQRTRSLQGTGSEWNDELSNSDESSADLNGRKPVKAVASPKPLPRASLASGSSVPDLAVAIEQQLSRRSGKPAGGVDVMFGGPSSSSQSDRKADSSGVGVFSGKHPPNSNGLSSSLEEAFSVTSKNKPMLTTKGDTENSSNTAATSVWGSSNSKQKPGATKRSETASRLSSSVVSVSSWDSDDDVSS